MRLTMYNLSVLSLYFHSYGIKIFPESFIVFEVDTSPFIYDTNDRDWRKKNTYCYEISFPDSNENATGEKIRDDLNRYFGLNGRMEKRNILCSVITQNTVRPASLAASNTTVSLLVSQLNTRYLQKPFINETNSEDAIYIDPKIEVKDAAVLKTVLEQQGFAVTEAMREVEVFVLSKK